MVAEHEEHVAGKQPKTIDSRNRTISQVTWMGLIVNVGLSIVKITVGVWGSSQALLADGVHSVTDLISDVMIIIGVRFWSEPPDERHPHGHRRIETAVALGIGTLLVLTAGGLMVHAIRSLFQRLPPPEWIALAAAAASLLIKETLYRYTARYAASCQSDALAANAWHHRSDAFSSIPVLIAVAGIRIQPAWSFLDPLAAMAVSVFIFRSALRIVTPSAGKLIDTGAPEDVIRAIREAAFSIPHVRDVHKIRTRYIGDVDLAVDLHIEVDAHMTVLEGHEVSTRVKEVLMQTRSDIIDVVVHLEPFTGQETGALPVS
ncbi:cation transporter [bacterium]|nr:cation transporter [candidate division CSSED10-310 bacterium]